MKGIIHGCPKPGSMYTPCCRITPFDLPRHDRITNDPSKVNCWTGDDPRLTGGAR